MWLYRAVWGCSMLVIPSEVDRGRLCLIVAETRLRKAVWGTA